VVEVEVVHGDGALLEVTLAIKWSRAQALEHREMNRQLDSTEWALEVGASLARKVVELF